MANYLVTGGAGFIGSHIARRLVREGHTVRVLDNFSSGKIQNLAPVRDDVEVMEADIRDDAACRKACQGMDAVFHEAALPSVPRSVDKPADSHAVNIDGTFNVLMGARDAGCPRVIYAASSSAYGDQPDLPKHEGMMPSPLSPYALNKLVGEYYCSVFCKTYGMQAVSLRYFNVFGPYQDPQSQYAAAIPAFVSAILAGRQPLVYGDGEQTRDFTHVDNVVHANMLAAQADGLCGQVVNIACGERISINAIIQQINELLGKDIKPEYADTRAGDVKHSLADIALAREVLGFAPLLMFEEGLRQAIDWYKDNL